jgi:hypothetical protein
MFDMSEEEFQDYHEVWASEIHTEKYVNFVSNYVRANFVVGEFLFMLSTDLFNSNSPSNHTYVHISRAVSNRGQALMLDRNVRSTSTEHNIQTTRTDPHDLSVS